MCVVFLDQKSWPNTMIPTIWRKKINKLAYAKLHTAQTHMASFGKKIKTHEGPNGLSMLHCL